jgi:hypothetical protein
VFGRAGIQISRSAGGLVPIQLTGRDEQWNDQELNDAMEIHWSRFSDKPQWALWVLATARHEKGLRLGGVMFDAGLVQRQGVPCLTTQRYYPVSSRSGPRETDGSGFARVRDGPRSTWPIRSTKCIASRESMRLKNDLEALSFMITPAISAAARLSSVQADSRHWLRSCDMRPAASSVGRAAWFQPRRGRINTMPCPRIE